jgi:hypothetical protein
MPKLESDVEKLKHYAKPGDREVVERGRPGSVRRVRNSV